MTKLNPNIVYIGTGHFICCVIFFPVKNQNASNWIFKAHMLKILTKWQIKRANSSIIMADLNVHTSETDRSRWLILAYD